MDYGIKSIHAGYAPKFCSGSMNTWAKNLNPMGPPWSDVKKPNEVPHGPPEARRRLENHRDCGGPFGPQIFGTSPVI